MIRLRSLAIAVLFAGSISSIQAASITIASWQFNFDENGNGSITLNYNGAPSTQAFNGSLITDPSSNLGSVLAWNFATLPGFVTGGWSEGDVLIADPDASTSDLLRFADANGGTTGTNFSVMIFYSADVGGGLLADTGLPSVHGSFVGPTENSAGQFTYSPSPNTYNGLSGAVPEPATFSMLGIGLVGIGWIARKRRR
jgi:hypothetical protein